MSGECEKCGEHTMCCRCVKIQFCKECQNEKIACSCMAKTLDLSKKKVSKMVQVTMDQKDALELIYWARRYCDGRSTYAPSSFNDALKRIRSANESVILGDIFDQTLMDGGSHWPFAQDGMYDAQSGAYDATK